MKVINKIYNFIFSKINTIRYYIIEKTLYILSKKQSQEILKKTNPPK